MAETTISWTHKRLANGATLPGYTFNPWIGCTKVTPACDGCYAEHLMDTRLGRVEWGPHGERKRTSAANWRKPNAWNNYAKRIGAKPYVFCASLADVFDNQVPAEYRADLFAKIRECDMLEWLLLTKRPQNIIKLSEEAGGLPKNVALGTTIEDQKRADINVPHLLKAQIKLKPLFTFVSCEPLLGPIDLAGRGWLSGGRDNTEPKINWVITGGETDQGKHEARPSNPNWFRSLWRQCRRVDPPIPFHLKQNGEWREANAADIYDTLLGRNGEPPAFLIAEDGTVHCTREAAGEDAVVVVRVGKNSSGRQLDGIEHNAYPKAA